MRDCPVMGASLQRLPPVDIRGLEATDTHQRTGGRGLYLGPWDEVPRHSCDAVQQCQDRTIIVVIGVVGVAITKRLFQPHQRCLMKRMVRDKGPTVCPPQCSFLDPLCPLRYPRVCACVRPCVRGCTLHQNEQRLARAFFFVQAQQVQRVSCELSGNRLVQEVGHIVQTRAPHLACVPALPGELSLFTTCLVYPLHMHYAVPRLLALCCGEAHVFSCVAR